MDAELLKRAKSLAARDYQIQVQEEVERDGASIWVAYVSEMPSCAAQAGSAEAAMQALKTVKEDYIYFRLKRGVPIPEPSPERRDAMTRQIRAYSGRINEAPQASFE